MKKIVVGVSTVLLFVLAMGSSNGRSDATKIFNQKKLPTFNRVLLLEQTSETSANVSIGDLNGDGFPDLVLAKGRHWPLIDRVLLNDGHGGFTSAHNLGDVAGGIGTRGAQEFLEVGIAHRELRQDILPVRRIPHLGDVSSGENFGVGHHQS